MGNIVRVILVKSPPKVERRPALPQTKVVRNRATPSLGRFSVHMEQQHDLIPVCPFGRAGIKYSPNLK
jgi:hypothetical protein